MQYNAILFRLQLPMDDNDVSSFIHVNNNYPEDILYNTVWNMQKLTTQRSLENRPSESTSCQILSFVSTDCESHTKYNKYANEFTDIMRQPHFIYVQYFFQV